MGGGVPDRTTEIGPIDLSGDEFGAFLNEVEADAHAAGPEVVAQNEFFKEQALLAGVMLQRRLELGWSQKELGERCGLDQAEISRIENLRGNPRYAKLATVAHALGYRLTLAPINPAPARRSYAPRVPRTRSPRPKA